MSVINDECIPSGVYTITNVKHDRSITCRDDQRLAASSASDYKWIVDKRADKGCFIQSNTRDISIGLPMDLVGEGDAKEGDEVFVQHNLHTPREWTIKQCGAQDTYLVFSPSEITLFWSLPDPEAPIQLSSTKGESSLWRFKPSESGVVENIRPIDVEPLSVDRPTLHPSTLKHKVTITIPSGWHTHISADTAQKCTNLILVSRTLQGVLKTQSFLGMRDHAAMILEGTYDVNSLAIEVSDQAEVLELEFFHSRNPEKLDPLKLPEQKDLSSKLKITSMERPNDMSSFSECMQFTISDDVSISDVGVFNKFTFKAATASIRFSKTQSKPKPGTVNLGYNDSLDKPRPAVLDQYLLNYDITFIVDDSGSMVGQRWSEVRHALAQIANEATLYDADGFDICFLNSSVYKKNITSEAALLDVFKKVQPRFRTPTGARLKVILNEAIKKLDGAVNTPEYTKIKPLDIVVVTDGSPTDRLPADKPEAVIKAAAIRLDEGKHHLNAIRIQFLQIGDEEGAEEALKALCEGHGRRMVHTVRYERSFTPENLMTVLLGARHSFT